MLRKQIIKMTRKRNKFSFFHILLKIVMNKSKLQYNSFIGILGIEFAFSF